MQRKMAEVVAQSAKACDCQERVCFLGLSRLCIAAAWQSRAGTEPKTGEPRLSSCGASLQKGEECWGARWTRETGEREREGESMRERLPAPVLLQALLQQLQRAARADGAAAAA